MRAKRSYRKKAPAEESFVDFRVPCRASLPDGVEFEGYVEIRIPPRWSCGDWRADGAVSASIPLPEWLYRGEIVVTGKFADIVGLQLRGRAKFYVWSFAPRPLSKVIDVELLGRGDPPFPVDVLRQMSSIRHETTA